MFANTNSEEEYSINWLYIFTKTQECDPPGNELVSHVPLYPLGLHYLGDGPNSLSTSLPEHQSLFAVQVLRGFDEAEMDRSLVPCP